MNTRDTEDLRRRVAEFEWYHSIDLGGGVVTPGRDYDYMWSPTLSFMNACPFDGKRVLDIGCWDGLFSFYAERRGAAEVIATDVHPRPTFDLAAMALGSNVMFKVCSAYQLSRTYAADQFDLIICNGVLYHLMAPLLALVEISKVLRPGGTLLLESAYYGSRRDKPYVYISHGNDQLYPGDPSSCSFPTPQCFERFLEMTLLERKRLDCYIRGRPTGRLLIEATRVEGKAPDLFFEYHHDVL